MNNEWLITFRSVTYAQKAERALRMGRIPCRMQRTPKYLTERGCGYCLRLGETDIPAAVEILRREKLPYEKMYAIHSDGTTEVRTL